MTGPEIDRRLRAADIGQMIQLVRADWEVASAPLVEDGVSAIYEVDVATPAGRQTCEEAIIPGEKRG